jgi:hypothetical protein
MLADQAEMVVFLWRQGILEKEKSIRLELAGQLNCQRRWHTFVNVMQQLDLVSKFFPGNSEQLNRLARIIFRLEYVERRAGSVHILVGL